MMTHRLRNVVVAVTLALLAALLTSLYVTSYRKDVRSKEQNVPVYVAAQDIPVGTSGADLTRKGMLEKTELVRRSVVPGAISDPAQLEDLVATQAIFAGEQVTTRRFATPAERGIRAQLSGTMRAVQLPGDQHQLLAGTLRAGDRVDVVASIKIDPAQDIYATRIILRDIEVLKAAQNPGADIQVGAGNSLSVLLAVSDTQVQKLFHVAKHHHFSLELRPPVKSNDSPESVAHAGSILTDGLSAAQLERLRSGGNR